MVMYDGDAAANKALADENGLTFPILSDPNYEMFNRWEPGYETPSTTLIDRGMKVAEIGTTWYPAQIEELVYGEEL